MTTPFDAFGPGIAIVTRTDIANQTPVNVGFAQECTIDISGSIKELYGQNQYALDAARGTVKVTGKIKAAVISGLAWNSVFFGETLSSGGIKWNPGEAQIVPATPFQVTVTNAATFDQDLGVINATTGLPLTKVASAPATGQYSVSNVGVYTFAAADTGLAVTINYTSTLTGGQSLTITNKLLGTSPTFQLDYYTSRNSKALVVRLFQCQGSKLAMAPKLEDFLMPEFDFAAFANSAGNIGKITYPEVS